MAQEYDTIGKDILNDNTFAIFGTSVVREYSFDAPLIYHIAELHE